MRPYLAKSAIPCVTFLCTILAGTSSAIAAPAAQAAQGQIGFATASGAGRSAPDGGVAGTCPGALCPVSAFDGTYVCLDQNCDKSDNNSSVSCVGAGTLPNGYARCFDIAAEMPNLTGSFQIASVKWAVQSFDSASGDIQPITINVYLDTSGSCSLLFGNALLLASGTQLVTVGDAGTVFVTPVINLFGQQPVINPTDFIIIEIEAAVNGNLGTPGNNYAFFPRSTAAACSDALIRSAACGIPDWAGVSAIGFPTSQYLIQANGQLVGAAKAQCGNGILEACEECDDGSTTPGDGCDENCQIEVEPPQGPPNDICVNRIFIEQDVPTAFDTTLATTDGPPAPAACTGGGGPVNDIWFNWDSGFTGEVDVTVCEELGGDATFDTVIVVYDGCSCAPLPPVLGCNDDDPINACGTGAGGFHSTANVPVVAGNCYKIQVGGFSGGAGGPGTLLISKRVPPPSEGACCFPDGSCVDGLIEADCSVLGGAFQGGGSNCADANCPQPGPNNDLCADRRPAFQGKTPFDNTGATLDGPACDGNMTGDVWFNYIATETGSVDIDTCQSVDFPAQDTVLTVYDGCDPCPVDCTTELASGDDECAPPGGNPFASAVKIPVVAGNCYKIQIGGFNGAQGAGILTITKQLPAGACCLPDGSCQDVADEAACNAQGGTFQGTGTDCLSVECPQPPPNNDLCADRRPAFQGKTPFDNTGASLDGPACDGNMTGDVWFNYIATETGTVDIDTCQSEDFPDNDTVLTVYDGCDPCPVDCTTELASGDDECAAPGGGSAFLSSVKIPVVAGNCYKIQVGGFNGAQGAGILTIAKQPAGGACCLKDGTCVDGVDAVTCSDLGGTFQGGGTDCAGVICPPANDNCDNRLPIFNGLTDFDTVGASTDGPGVPCTPLGPVNDIWYNYTADFTGEINVTTCEELGGSANFDTVLAVYDGCVCDPLSPILGCNDDDPNNACGSGGGGFHSTVVVPVVAGNCYKIRLGGFSGGSAGSGTLNIFKKAPSGPSLDIKPGSCPNSYNRGSHGVLPVALVGTDTFDVTQVDLSSILLVRKDGEGGSVAPNEGPPGPFSEFEDTATPFAGEEQCDCHELEGDGLLDLMMHFKTDEVVPALGLNDFDPGALVPLTLIGTLLDGTPFSASDCVRLVPPGAGDGLLAVGSNLPGAWLDLSPLDLQLDGGGFADFERSFPDRTVVTLTAPMVYHDWVFFGWRINGGLVPGQSIDVTMGEQHLQQIEAIYRPHAAPPDWHLP